MSEILSRDELGSDDVGKLVAHVSTNTQQHVRIFRAKAEYDSPGDMFNAIPLEIWQRYVDTTSFTNAESTELLDNVRGITTSVAENGEKPASKKQKTETWQNDWNNFWKDWSSNSSSSWAWRKEHRC